MVPQGFGTGSAIGHFGSVPCGACWIAAMPVHVVHVHAPARVSARNGRACIPCTGMRCTAVHRSRIAGALHPPWARGCHGMHERTGRERGSPGPRRRAQARRVVRTHIGSRFGRSARCAWPCGTRRTVPIRWGLLQGPARARRASARWATFAPWTWTNAWRVYLSVLSHGEMGPRSMAGYVHHKTGTREAERGMPAE
jgi:hypothetical protein